MDIPRRTEFTHTLNPVTGREITIYRVRFNLLLKHGYHYDPKLNLLYKDAIPDGAEKYVPRPRIASESNRWMLVNGLAHRRLKQDGYVFDERDGKWKPKEEVDTVESGDDADSESEPDVDDLDYDDDWNPIIPEVFP